MSKYRKFFVALIGAVIVILGRHYGTNNLYVLDFISLAIALGVYATPNAE